MKVELRIDMVIEEDNKECIQVIAGNRERFEFHGSGTFMRDVMPGEIECTQEALDFLLGCPERGGLRGLEFWPQRMMAWGTQDQILTIPLDDINVPEEAKGWMKGFKIVKRDK